MQLARTLGYCAAFVGGFVVLYTAWPHIAHWYGVVRAVADVAETLIPHDTAPPPDTGIP